MILVEMQGGLGNQLFQYAAARSLGIKNNIPFLFFDVRHYSSDYLGRQLGIQNFNIKGTILRNKLALKAFRKNTTLNDIFFRLGQSKNIIEQKFVLHDLGDTRLFTTLTGFWQSAYYFENIRSKLLRELVPREVPDFPGWLNHGNTVAVGVRRTDYLVDTKYGFIGMKYYEDAFELVKRKVKDPLFIFFSDDLDWCKQNFKSENAIFFEDPNWSKDYLKVYLMSKCTHQITSNSSFYWWAAWLNTNPGKLVIRPSRPFNDPDLLYEAHYPAEWTIINNDSTGQSIKV